MTLCSCITWRARGALGLTAGLLTTALGGCGGAADPAAPGTSPAAQEVLDMRTLVDLLDAYRQFTGLEGLAADVREDLAAAVLDELMEVPRFQAILEGSGVTPDQAEALVAALLARDASPWTPDGGQPEWLDRPGSR